jgi:hypothetical protein
MEPLTVMLPVVPVRAMVRFSPLSEMGPLNVGAVVVPLLPMVNTPVELAFSEMGFDSVNVLPRMEAALLEALPSVTVEADGPNAPLTVVALLTLKIAVPAPTVRPPVKMLAPVKVYTLVPSLTSAPVPKNAAAME